MDPPDLLDDDTGIKEQLRNRISGGKINYNKLKNEQCSPPQKSGSNPPPTQPKPACKVSPRSGRHGSAKSANPPQRPSYTPGRSRDPRSGLHVNIPPGPKVEEEVCPLIDLTASPPTTAPKPSVDIFDSLCISQTDSRYNNIKLPAPLLGDSSSPDPFDVNARFSLLASGKTWNIAWTPKWAVNEGDQTQYNAESLSTSQQYHQKSEVTCSAKDPPLNQPGLSLGHKSSSHHSGSDRSSAVVNGGLLYCEPPVEDDLKYRGFVSSGGQSKHPPAGHQQGPPPPLPKMGPAGPADRVHSGLTVDQELETD